MDRCYICGKIITLDHIKHKEVIWKKEKNVYVHIGKCEQQFDKQIKLFNWGE